MYLIFTTGKLVEKTNQTVNDITTNGVGTNKKRKSEIQQIQKRSKYNKRKKNTNKFYRLYFKFNTRNEIICKNNENLLNHEYFQMI